VKRIQKILESQTFQKYLDATAAHEENREFCRHDLDHLLTVSRLAYLFSLEEGAKIPKEKFYAAGLLHDVGRFRQYEDGEDHAAASRELAMGILAEAAFSEEEGRAIGQAIEEHRKPPGATFSSPLARYLWKGDKHSRLCFACASAKRCKSLARMPNAAGLAD
jgi:uncharacterized protein